MAKRRKKSQVGGQKPNETGTVGTALALLYLQRQYPDTFIQFNANQLTGTSPHDIEQWEGKPEALWSIRVAAGLPWPEWVEPLYRPLRVWEVKSLIQRNKRFAINLGSHRELMRKKTQCGTSYIFVLFTAWNYLGGQLHCEYRIQEVSGKHVSHLIANTSAGKHHRLSKRLLPCHLVSENITAWVPYTSIFNKLDTMNTAE